MLYEFTFMTELAVYVTGGILFSPEKAVEEVSHVMKTTF